MLQSIDDCDAPVREKSLRLLCQFRRLLPNDNCRNSGENPASQLQSHPSLPSRSAHLSDFARVEVVNADSDRVIDDILGVNDINLVSNITVTDATNGSTLKEGPVAVKLMKMEDFIEKIDALELDVLLKCTTVSSDLHVADLDSLVDDLHDCIHMDPSRPRPDCY